MKRTVGGLNNPTGNPQLPGNALGGGRGDNRFGRPQTNPSANQPGTTGTNSQVSKGKVEDFLQLRRDNNGKTLDGAAGRNGSDGASSAFSRNGNPSNDAAGRFKSGQLGPQKSADDLKKDADQAWVKRFGNGDGKPGGVFKGPNNGGDRDGKGDPRSGIVNLNGNKPGSRNWKFDKDFVDRNYKDWRKGSSDGKGGKGDYRDWSGQWKKGDRFAAADHIRHSWKNGKGKNLPFSKDWWGGHHHHDKHWNHWDHFGDRHYRPYHWWGWCSAPRLTTWVSFGWTDPCYWDYGPGEYIYCNNGVVYVNGAWFEPAPVFYQRTLVLAQQAPVWTSVQAAQVEWLPLGVFAIARDGVADQNVLVQLAVTRDGVIGGNIFNQLTGESFPIQGTVDKQSQRAAWTYTDSTGAQIVMESSIFNLTQPAATGLIHYGPDNIQVMELVRLEDPGAGM